MIIFSFSFRGVPDVAMGLGYIVGHFFPPSSFTLVRENVSTENFSRVHTKSEIYVANFLNSNDIFRRRNSNDRFADA